MDFTNLKKYDPEVMEAIELEINRQREHLELIASENFVSSQVMEAMGSQMTNKYAEGYPGRRYYGGCEFVDKVENLAIDRLKKLFGADHANVQPHSGSNANLGVYFAVLKPGDKVQVTMKMQMDFEGKFKIKALNPATYTVYCQLDLATDYAV